MMLVMCRPRMRRVERVAVTVFALGLVVLVAACEKSKGAAAGKQAPAAPPPAVVVADVLQKTVPIYFEFVARTDAVDTIQLRARVQAYLIGQHFEEGRMVAKDQLLFTMDSREYEAKVRYAQGQLAKAKAQLAFALLTRGKREHQETQTQHPGPKPSLFTGMRTLR